MGKRFSIDDLIQSPRRSPAIVHEDGKVALFTESTYNLEKKERKQALFLLDVREKKEVKLFESSEAREPVFLTSNSFLYLHTSEGRSTLRHFSIDSEEDYSVFTFDGAVANLRYERHSGYLVFSAFVGPNGKMLSAQEEKADDEQDAVVYDSLFVRHWDTWLNRKRQTIFVATVIKDPVADTLYISTPRNIIDNYKLESPVPALGDISDFSISQSHVAFLSKDPSRNPAWNNASHIWLRPLDGSSPCMRINYSKGASACPVISPNGEMVAFLEMETPGYESDRNQIRLYSIKNETHSKVVPQWDRSPASIVWAHDSSSLFVTADDFGHKRLFHIDIKSREPDIVVLDHSVSEVTALTTGQLFVSGSSFARAMIYTLVSFENVRKPVRETIVDGHISGLRDDSTHEFWFTSDGRDVHAFMIRPADFDPAKKYPMILVIHGGPQGAVNNSWSTRWNPSVMANHGEGYIVIAINFTGSTGYGQAFTDAIKGEWGGKPYDDLYNGFKHALAKYPFIDPDRCSAAGGSYGGYMINWIQGREMGRKLRALVCHDGVFDSANVWQHTDELYFAEHDFLGPPWEADARACYDRWNPRGAVARWRTPELVVHSARDYRLPETEALAAFAALQRRGVPSRLLTFRSENHFVLKPANSKIWHDTVLGWIEEHSGKVAAT